MNSIVEEDSREIL